jgi:transcriptional regulator with XRE-family HTH domain
MPQEPPSYGEIADALNELPAALRITRRVRRLSLREVARQSGIGMTVALRIEQGHSCTTNTAIKLLRWLDAPARPAGHDETGQ